MSYNNQIQVPSPGLRFGHPEGLADTNDGHAIFPLAILIRIQDVDLAITVEEVNDVAIGNRKGKILKSSGSGHGTTANREASRNRHGPVTLHHLSDKVMVLIL